MAAASRATPSEFALSRSPIAVTLRAARAGLSAAHAAESPQRLLINREKAVIRKQKLQIAAIASENDPASCFEGERTRAWHAVEKIVSFLAWFRRFRIAMLGFRIATDTAAFKN
jgi:hypothetical protein